MAEMDDNLPPVLPVGTAVVAKLAVKGRGGAVGRVVQSPVDMEHSYRVRFVGGEEAMLRRAEIAVLSHYQNLPFSRDPQGSALAEHDLRQYVIYRCIVGSRAYGLDNAESDYDRRGIYLPLAEMHWSLFGVPEQLESTDPDECYWELEKFLTLALKANPNVLEVLYSPIVELATPLAEELLAMRSSFLSKLVYQTYNGYVMSQFSKLQQDLRNRGAIKWKHAMHLVRLLVSGITILKRHTVPVRVSEHRDRLLAIRDGQVPWEEVDAWRLDLGRQFEAAYAVTTLPDRPDYAAANELLIKARRSMV